MMREAGRNRGRYVWLLLPFLAAILFSGPLLRGEALIPGDIVGSVDDAFSSHVKASNPLQSDVIFQFFPWQSFLSASIRHGIMPLWNPFVLGGTPFVANDQVAPFEPVRIVLTLIGVPAARTFLPSAILRLSLFGAFVFLYLRGRKFPRMSAMLSAALAACSTVSVAWVSYPLFAAFLWTPLLLHAVDRLGDRPKRGLTLLAVGTAAQLFAGNVQMSLFVFAFVVVYGLTVYIRSPRTFLRIGAGLAIGAVLASAQLLPTIAFITGSSQYETGRGGNAAVSIAQAVRNGEWTGWHSAADVKGSFLEVAPILFPFINGNPAAGHYAFPRGDITLNFNELAGSLGTIGMFLALIGAIAAWRKKSVKLFAIVGVVCVGVVAHAPILQLVNYLPIINKTSTGRLRFLIVVCAAMLAAYGIRAFLERRVGWKLPAALAVVISAFHYALVRFGLDRSGKGYQQFLLTVGSFGLLWMGWWFFSQRRSLAVAYVSIALLGVPVVMLAGYNTSVPASTLVPTDPVLQTLQKRLTPQDRFVATGSSGGLRTPLVPNTTLLYGLRDLRGYEVVRLRRTDETLQGVLEQSGSYLLRVPKPSPVLDMFSVRYALIANDASDAGQQFLDAGWRTVDQDDRVLLLENPKALPRVYTTSTVTSVQDADASLAFVRNPDFLPAASVVVEQGVKTTTTVSYPIVPGNIVSETANAITFEVQSDRDGYAVITDSFNSAWHAWVDGQRTPVIPANHAVRAVAVTAGSHTVIMRYQPASWGIGLILSVFGFLGMVCMMLGKQQAATLWQRLLVLMRYHRGRMS